MPLVARIVFFCLLVHSIQANASHLAGGELQIQHVKDDQHRISLILFFDEINGSPGAKDQSATARIFRESDGAFIMDVVMFLEGETRLSFSQVDCKINGLSTLRLSYSKVVDLPSATFGDAQGYYVVWERCCRNYGITNIFSENPQAGGTRVAGQTFFMHFPAVVEGGKSFINSSPVFTTPTNDYFCTNRINTLNFSASDADGDSLVYSMTAPLSTHDLGNALPTPKPKPYPEVLWRPSFSQTDIMGTGSELKISKRGVLTGRPTVQGLFAFAVKCEEFRNGKKIGEVRREYQLLVTNDCPPAGIAPVMLAKTLDGQYSDNALSVNFSNTVPDEQRCFSVKVTDGDALTSLEKVSLNIISLDGRIDGSSVLLPKANAELSASAQNVEFLVCFEKCIPNQITEFDIAVLVFDDGCPIGSSDTINVHVAIERPIRGCIFQTIDFPVVGDRALVDKTFALNATASSGLPVQYISSDETIASVNASVVTMHQTGFVVIKATQPGDADYLPALPISRLFCIKPTAPQIRLEDDNRTISSNAAYGNIWFVDGVQNSQLNGKTITITGPLRNYTARVEANGCRSDESNGILITSVDEWAYDKDISVFPNPAIDVLSIDAPGGKDIRVEVWSMQGKMFIKPSDIQSTHHLNLESISAGVYLVKIHVGGAVLIRKFVKN